MYIILKSSLKLSASFKHSSNYYYWMLYPVGSKTFSFLEHYFNFAALVLQEKQHLTKALQHECLRQVLWVQFQIKKN